MSLPQLNGSACWVPVCDVESVLPGGGACVTFEGVQVAIFRMEGSGKWYATQNRCPHWNEMVLSRALTGSHGDEPKIACPMHKRTFSLRDGRCLSGDDLAIETFAVRVEEGVVYLSTPGAAFLERERSATSEARQPRTFAIRSSG